MNKAATFARFPQGARLHGSRAGGLVLIRTVMTQAQNGRELSTRVVQMGQRDWFTSLLVSSVKRKVSIYDG